VERLVAKLVEAQEHETATAEILRVISRSRTDSQPVFDAIARNAVVLCGGIAAVVLRFDGEMLHVAAYHALSPEGVEKVEQAYPRRPGRDYPPGRALLDRSVVHVPDLQAATEFTASTARQRGAGSFLAVPLLRDGEAIGVIGLARDAVGPFRLNRSECFRRLQVRR
jgi:two-component system, NtrC family, sensor kinase